MPDVMTLSHEAHVGYVQHQIDHDIKNAIVVGYNTWCEDCDWSCYFPAKEHPNVLWAWNEAARARDLHHDTHEKEIEE